jgi:hypothetical protein
MKKTLLLLVLATCTTEIFAAANPLLQCLAKEENQFHKEKSQGTLYRLNQDFINELASSNDITLKRQYIDEVCNGRIHSPSVALLRLLMIKESDIYDLSLTEVDAQMRPFKMGYINEFQKQVPHIFVRFISGLQSETATADCLPKAIPELKFFNERLKYLEDEMSAHEMVKDKNKIEAIFKKLQNLKSIKANCEKLAQSKMARLKARAKQNETAPSDSVKEE